MAGDKLQPDLSLEGLLQQAKESQPLLQQEANALLERLRVKDPELFKNVRFEMGPLKTQEDAINKINTDYSNHRQIKDLVRGRFIVDDPKQIEAIQTALHQEMNVSSFKNKYQTPDIRSGYRDINTKVVLENGHIAEIQVQHADMLKVNKPTHNLREQAEKIREQAAKEKRPLTEAEVAETKALETEARNINNAAAHDAKLNGLLDPSVAGKFTYKGPLDLNRSALGTMEDLLRRAGKANKNIIFDVGIGAAVGGATLLNGGDAKAAAFEAAQTLNPVPETTTAIVENKSMGEIAEAGVKDASMLAGCAGGAVAGAKLAGATGLALGTMAPGVGNAIGGTGGLIAGGIVGCAAGAWAASDITDRLINFFRGQDETPPLQEIRNILPDKPDMALPPEFEALREVRSSDSLLTCRLEEMKGYGGFETMLHELEQQKNLMTGTRAPEPGHALREDSEFSAPQNYTPALAQPPRI